VKNADGDGFKGTEANTERIDKGKFLTGLPGSKNVACMERSTRNFGDPSSSYEE
jgi:hypothetical protein